MMVAGKTLRRTQVLEFVQRHCAVHGFGPSLRQIAAAVGFRSPSTAEYHVNQLIDRGLLVRPAGKVTRRTIRPAGDVPETLPDAVRRPVSGGGELSPVFRFVEAYVRTHGYGPTMREIAAAVHLRSVSTVAYHVEDLIGQGLLTRRESQGRAVPRSLRPAEYRKVA